MHTAELVVRGQVFEEEGLHVADVRAEGGDVVVFWVAEREVGGVEGGFFAGGVDGDDVGAGGEGGGAEEGEQIVGEAHAYGVSGSAFLLLFNSSSQETCLWSRCYLGHVSGLSIHSKGVIYARKM